MDDPRLAESSLEADLHGVRNRLLPLTVRRAWDGSAFYRRLYERAGIDPDAIRTVADLSQLPIVRKPDIRAAGREARCFPDTTAVSHVQHTSGTTGAPFFFYRSASEVRFIQQFFSDLCRDVSPDETPGPLPLTLVLSGMDWHGTPTPIPGNAFPIHCSLLSESYFETAAGLLRRHFDIPGVGERVHTITGSNELLTFTSWCLERGIRCREEFAVRTIQMTGFYLTSRWRKLLCDTWGAVVLDRFSMAEHFGGATMTSDEDGFRFDPHIVYELVDFSGTQCIQEGPGMLVLTSLYPFVQLQPLIRYWTGDIFAVHPTSRAGAPSFRFLGRESQALFHPDRPNDLLLSGVALTEALDGFPEVARTPNFREDSRLRFSGADGYPIFRGRYVKTGGKLKLVVQVALFMSPDTFPSARQRLTESMHSAICLRAPRLTALIQSGEAELTIEYVPPDVLDITFGTEMDRFEVAPRTWTEMSQ